MCYDAAKIAFDAAGSGAVIDDYAQAMALVERMEAALPIPARPTRQLADILRSHGFAPSAHPKLEIKRVLTRRRGRHRLRHNAARQQGGLGVFGDTPAHPPETPAGR